LNETSISSQLSKLAKIGKINTLTKGGGRKLAIYQMPGSVDFDDELPADDNTLSQQNDGQKAAGGARA